MEYIIHLASERRGKRGGNPPLREFKNENGEKKSTDCKRLFRVWIRKHWILNIWLCGVRVDWKIIIWVGVCIVSRPVWFCKFWRWGSGGQAGSWICGHALATGTCLICIWASTNVWFWNKYELFFRWVCTGLFLHQGILSLFRISTCTFAYSRGTQDRNSSILKFMLY